MKKQLINYIHCSTQEEWTRVCWELSEIGHVGPGGFSLATYGMVKYHFEHGYRYILLYKDEKEVAYAVTDKGLKKAIIKYQRQFKKSRKVDKLKKARHIKCFLN